MRKKKIVAMGMVGMMVMGTFAGSVQAKQQTTVKHVDIMFTSDIHSHVESFTAIKDGKKVEVGGLDKIKTLINQQKEKNPNTLVVDGGDFSMGTLIQTVYETQAAELRLLGDIGCEVSTFGNHEFDYRTDGMVNMLNAAIDSGDILPQLVICNIDWSKMNKDQKALKEVFDRYQVKPYVILQKGDVKIAVTGVFGKDALDCAPTCALKFTDPVEAVSETVKEIKEKENPDMIVCVSHSGISDKKSKSEDEILAKKVPELDVIVSGHTHSILEEPIVHKDTYIVASGEYGKNIGSISLNQREDGRWEVTDYELIPVTKEISSNEETSTKIKNFQELVDEEYLKQFGYTSDEVVAKNEVEFSSVSEIYGSQNESNLGDMIADAYLYGARSACDEKVDVAVVPNGCIRDTYTTGNITIADVFQSFSLGIGPDKVPGYPLVKVYLTGKELKTAAEIDASVAPLMPYARLNMSGLNFTCNQNRMILNRVTDINILNAAGKEEKIDDDKLYCVVSDLYTGQMISGVTDMSHGLLSIVPKDEDGKPIKDLEKQIIYKDGKEVKAWVSIAEYMQSFEKDDEGYSHIPAVYENEQGRKVMNPSKKVIDLVKNPNKYVAMIFGFIVVLIIIIILIIRLIKRIVRRCIRKK